ncbi:Non-specific serine/threonine protein kinase [Bertholletia excelsa]
MQKRLEILLLLKGLIIIALTCSILVTGGESSDLQSYFFGFIRAVDPKNILQVDLNGLVPHPCSPQWKGLIRCNSQGTNIRAIRLENLNLSGTIEADSLCNLSNLQALSLARNRIQGPIPESIQNCKTLEYLNLNGNHLNGTVPSKALAKLKNLERLDISNNQFCGTFLHPKQVTRDLNRYTVEPGESSTNLGDKDPKPFGKWATWVGLKKTGRLDICIKQFSGTSQPAKRDLDELKIYTVEARDSPPKSAEKKTKQLGKWVLWMSKKINEKKALNSPAKSPHRSPPPPKDVEEVKKPNETRSRLVFFVEEEERFTMDDLLEAAADLRSQGLSSSLYRVTLKNNALFAVKRLKKLQVSFKEFHETMGRIGRLEHPNILPLVGYNSASEEKLLIYRYQRNGSLLSLQENYIEGKRDFPWRLRLSIAVGIARGLNFIYQSFNGEEVIPHGNIKPSNILLGENEEPLISEYGFSMFLDPKKVFLFSNGYTPPEKSLSERADVFSLGVIMLELLTGKQVEKSGLDLPKWVKSMVREEWTGEVFDKKLKEEDQMYAFPLLNISLKCVAHFPENRPSMAEVLEKTEEIVHAQEELTPSPVDSTLETPESVGG